MLKKPNMSLDSILFKFYQIEDELSKTLSNESFAEFNNQAGLIFYSRSEIELALSYFQKAEMLYLNADLPKQASRMLSNQAVILEIKGNYKEAANLYIDALKSFNDSIKADRKAIAYIYNNLGVLYEEMGILENAVFHYKKALMLKKELNDTMGIASTLNNNRCCV